MRKLLLLLLLPSLLWAGEFTVKKPDRIEQPAGMVDRVSMRGESWKVFQDSAHFNAGDYEHGQFQLIVNPSGAPMHYQDSTGKWQEYKYAAEATTGEYDRVIRSGKWEIQYSTAKPGKMRFERRKGWIAFDPAFTVSQVGVEYVIGPHGLKENLHLEASSPRRLAWGYDYSNTHEKEAKGKGRIKNLLNQTIAELGEFTAKDSAGGPVSLTVSYTADSLIVLVNAAGKVTVDPSVNDTSLVASSGYGRGTWLGAGGWVSARDSANAAVMGAWGDDTPIGINAADDTYRGFLTFDADLSGASTLDSAFLVVRPKYGTNHTDTIYVSQGTFTGAARAATWWGAFYGRVQAAAHSFTNMLVDGTVVVPTDTSGIKAFKFTTAGKDSIAVRITANDSVRLVLVNTSDYKFVGGASNSIVFGATQPYLILHYTSVDPPTVVVVADTTLPVIRFVGEITVTGGANSTVRGVKYWPSGTGDTVSVADTGSYGAAVYSKDSRAIRWNQTILYKTFAVNTTGIGYSAIDSVVVDSIGGGAQLIVDGREVDTWR